jgi:hypothetical protein
MCGSSGPTECKQKFACDDQAYCQSFILKNHKPDSYYKSMSDLKKTVAFCMKKEENTIVPRVDNVAIGWVCKTASLMNSKRDVSCIQTASGQTGETWLSTNQYLGESHGPDSFVGENVRPLFFNIVACMRVVSLGHGLLPHASRLFFMPDLPLPAHCSYSSLLIVRSCVMGMSARAVKFLPRS